MSEDTKIVVFVVVVTIAIFTVIFGGAAWSHAARCHTQFAAIGDTSWGLIQGCMVQLPNGRKLPASVFRGVIDYQREIDK